MKILISLVIISQVLIFYFISSLPRSFPEAKPCEPAQITYIPAITTPDHFEKKITVFAYYRKNPILTTLLEKPVAGGTCAVSRDLLHWIGGRIYIEGIGIRRVNDLMHTANEKSIDLYYGSEKEAKSFGKKIRTAVYLGR